MCLHCAYHQAIHQLNHEDPKETSTSVVRVNKFFKTNPHMPNILRNHPNF